MFEADIKMEEVFMRDVEGRRQRDAALGPDAAKEGHGFYDVTAWASTSRWVLNYMEIPERRLSNSAASAGVSLLLGGRMFSHPTSDCL